ncbi:endospore germination permease [Paenibacillus sp. MBLB4367]|uniref:GerAB/ArcD/ProY family transporter n=1 Tax=Paenibacillus sp. MBLB4367 TaxID=3384767 RepID=UPI003907F345
MSKPSVTVRQFTLLVALFTIGSSILFVPLGAIQSAKQDAWISILAGMGGSLAVIWLYAALARAEPRLTFVEMARKRLGPWLGTAVSLLFIFVSFAGGACSNLFYVGSFVATQIMPETPIVALNCLFAVAVVAGLRLGLGTLARSTEVLFIFFAVLFVLMVLFVIPEMKGAKLRPVMVSGFLPIVKGVLSYMSYSSFPVIVMLMVIPSTAMEPKRVWKAFWQGNLLGGMFLFTLTVVCISVLGAEMTGQLSYPNYVLAQKINIGSFITRIEVFMATIWMISLFIKLNLYFYASLKGLGQLLRLRDDSILIYPLGVLMVVWSLIIYPDTVYQAKWDENTWPPAIFTVGLIVPLIVLISSALAKKKAGMRPG